MERSSITDIQRVRVTPPNLQISHQRLRSGCVFTTRRAKCLTSGVTLTRFPSPHRDVLRHPLHARHVNVTR